MFSPCLYASDLKKVAAPCDSASYPMCEQDPRNHSVAYVPKQLKTVTPIGIAKDGRVIYGPFKPNGELWQPCDVDVCNGRYFNDYYGYVSTMFHPYFVGCFGPGNSPSISQSCSSNPRICKSSGASGLIYSSVMVLLSLATFLAAF